VSGPWDDYADVTPAAPSVASWVDYGTPTPGRGGARINPTTVRTAERGGYQAGRNDQTANRGLELWRQQNALQRNPYLQMGGP